MNDAPVLLRFDARRLPLTVLLVCFAAEIALFTLDYFLNYGHAIDIDPVRQLFSTTLEGALASWFAVTQTTLSALTLWAIFAIQRAKGASWLRTGGWLLLALFFSYMAMDDGAEVHERLGTTLRVWREEGGWDLDDVHPSYSWQFFVLPFFATMGLFMLGFVWFQMKDSLSRILLLLALGMLATAVAIDFVEGLDEDHPWNVYRILADTLDVDTWTRARFGKNGFVTIRHFFKSAEECFMEAGANSILWFLWLRHLIREASTIHIRFVRRAGPGV